MGRFLATLGRLMVAIIFVLFGLMELEKLTGADSAERVKLYKPQIDHALDQVQKLAGMDLPVKPEHYQQLMVATAVLQVTGAILFFLNVSLGGLMMIASLVGITPVLHNFWDEEVGSDVQMEQMRQFFKNLSMVGGILAYIAKPTRRKEKND